MTHCDKAISTILHPAEADSAVVDHLDSIALMLSASPTSQMQPGLGLRDRGPFEIHHCILVLQFSQ